MAKGHPAELRASHYKRFFQKAALPQVADQRRSGLIEDVRVHVVLLLERVVPVPIQLAARRVCAVEEQGEKLSLRLGNLGTELNRFRARLVAFFISQFAILVFHACEERLHRIIVGGGNGIKFVIMAAGAADSHGKKSVCGVHYDFIKCGLPREPLLWMQWRRLARNRTVHTMVLPSWTGSV